MSLTTALETGEDSDKDFCGDSDSYKDDDLGKKITDLVYELKETIWCYQCRQDKNKDLKKLYINAIFQYFFF